MTQQHNCRCEIVAEWRLIMDGGIWGKGLLLIKVTRCKSRKVVIHTHKVMEFSHRWIHLPLSLTNPLLKLPFLLNVLRRRCESGLWDLSAVLLFLSPSLSFNDNYNLGHTRGRCTHTHTGSLTTHPHTAWLKNMKTLAVAWCWVSIDLLSGGLESERTLDSTLSQHLTI